MRMTASPGGGIFHIHGIFKIYKIEKALTLEEIDARFNLTRERVHQIWVWLFDKTHFHRLDEISGFDLIEINAG